MLAYWLKQISLIGGLALTYYTLPSQSAEAIDLWYGPAQVFGQIGTTQPWVNILGSVKGDSTIKLSYRINGSKDIPLSLGPDLHRLARSGDFNIDLDFHELNPGNNRLTIIVDDGEGHLDSTNAIVMLEKGNVWPLPYTVDFRTVKRLQSVVQVVDGHWKLTTSGVRTAEPYYDRVISVGDTTWRDYEVLIELTVHGWTPSQPGPPTYNVTHFGTALRWRGHHDDGRQPRRKWHPLGAQGEFLLKENRDSCQWRILFDGGRSKPKKYSDPIKHLQKANPMFVRASVHTLPDGRSQYQFKQWMAGESEPVDWDVIGKESNDYRSGALCIVPHHSDVTIHRLEVVPIF